LRDFSPLEDGFIGSPPSRLPVALAPPAEEHAQTRLISLIGDQRTAVCCIGTELQDVVQV
jgi:hypothetical protein